MPRTFKFRHNFEDRLKYNGGKLYWEDRLIFSKSYWLNKHIDLPNIHNNYCWFDFAAGKFNLNSGIYCSCCNSQITTPATLISQHYLEYGRTLEWQGLAVSLCLFCSSMHVYQLNNDEDSYFNDLETAHINFNIIGYYV